MNQEVQSSSQELKTQTQNYEQCEQPIKICRQQLDFFKVQLLYSDRKPGMLQFMGSQRAGHHFL